MLLPSSLTVATDLSHDWQFARKKPDGTGTKIEIHVACVFVLNFRAIRP